MSSLADAPLCVPRGIRSLALLFVLPVALCGQSGPSNVSIFPASGSGYMQNFTFTSSPRSGANAVYWMEMLVHSQNVAANGCFLAYWPESGAVGLAGDSGGTWDFYGYLGAGVIENSQCAVNLAASYPTPDPNSVIVTLALTFKAGFAGNRLTFLQTGDITGLIAPWQQLGTWTVTAAPVMTADSVTPSSGTGMSRTFTFTVGDTAGGSAVNEVYAIINSPFSYSGGCFIYYYRPWNMLFLANDSDSAWQGSSLVGSGGTVSNSQCSISGTGASTGGSGNQFSLSVPVTFQSAFVGTKSVYLQGVDVGGAYSGWQSRGAWTVGQVTVTADSVSPSSGTGMSQMFAFAVSDSAGAASVNEVYAIISSPFAYAPSCFIYYYRPANTLYLANDNDSAWVGASVVGSGGSLSNSQCSISGAPASVTVAGNQLILSVPVIFKTLYNGSKTVYVQSTDAGGAYSGWQALGNWTVPATIGLPSNVSVTPTSGSGASGRFSFTFSSPGGGGYVTWAEMLLNYDNVAAGGCMIGFWPQSREVRLAGDTGGQWPLSGQMGSGTLSNSQCRIDLSTAAATVSGNNLTVTLDIAFLAGLPGKQRVFLQCGDAGDMLAEWQEVGDWTITAPSLNGPQPISVTPSSGVGMGATFHYTASSDNGAAYIVQVNAVIAASPADTANACYVVYDHFAQRFNLLDDAGGWTAAQSTAWGSGGTQIHNRRCTLDGTRSSAASSGNTVTMDLALTFDNSWTGSTKNNYLYATDRSGRYSQWLPAGTWRVSPPPDFSVTTRNSSQTVASGSVVTYIYDTRTIGDWDGSSIRIQAVILPVPNCLSTWTQSTTWDPTAKTGTATLNLQVSPTCPAGSMTPQITWIGTWSDGSVSHQITHISTDTSLIVSGGGGVSVSITPVSASLSAGQSVVLTAYVSGAPYSSATWNNPSIGTLSQNGASATYTAPSTIAQNTTVTITATPALGTAGTATLTLLPASNHTPSVTSVTPSSGSGLGPQSFQFVWSDADGAADLRTLSARFTSTASDASACSFQYNQTTGALQLYNDGASALGTILSNSQCSLQSASGTASGNDFTLSLVITFTSAFSGAKDIGMNAVDAAGASSGWVSKGSWTVPAGGPDFSLGSASPVSVTPNSPATTSQPVTSVGGFSSPVTFDYESWPQGLVPDFGPNPLTPDGNTSITVTATSDAFNGTYDLPFTARSAGITHESTLRVTVSAASICPALYQLGTPPSLTRVHVGSSASFIENVQLCGITGPYVGSVSLWADQVPAGLTVTISPQQLTPPNSATITITAAQNATPGNYSFLLRTSVYTQVINVYVSNCANLTCGCTNILTETYPSASGDAWTSLSAWLSDVPSDLAPWDSISITAGTLTFPNGTSIPTGPSIYTSGVATVRAPVSQYFRISSVPSAPTDKGFGLYLARIQTRWTGAGVCPAGSGDGLVGDTVVQPLLTSMSQTNLTQGQAANVVLHGASLALSSGSGGVTAIEIWRDLPTSSSSGTPAQNISATFVHDQNSPDIRATVTAGANAEPRTYYVTLIAIGSRTNALQFTVQPSCTPTITSTKINAQETNTLIAGTSGTLQVLGQCLGGGSPAISIDGVTVTGTTAIDAQMLAASYQAGSSSGGLHSLSVTTAQGTSGTLPITVSKLTLTEVSFFGNIAYTKDCPTNLPPVAISNPVWRNTNTDPNLCSSTGPQNEAVVYSRGTTMLANVKISVVPPATADVSGIRVEGAIPGLGTFVKTGVKIPGGWTDFDALTSDGDLITADTALPSATKYYNPMTINWAVAADGSTCTPTNGACVPVGTSSNTVYVTLDKPFLPDPNTPPMRTAIHLAVSNDGAATAAEAVRKTWDIFALTGGGPADVKAWDGRPLYYYRNDPPGGNDPKVVGFKACANDAVGLLTQENGSGQCGSWAHLLEYAFASNGIPVQTPLFPNAAARVWFTWVVPTNGQLMVVKDWEFAPTATYAPLYAMTLNSVDFMVPHTGNQFGDLTNLSTVFGQNSRPPSEKVFGQHFIVRVADELLLPGAPQYLDPSYGKTYVGGAEFQSQSVDGFGQPDSVLGAGHWMVQKTGPTTPTNITLAGSPTSPALSSPADLFSSGTTSVTLSWLPVPGATQYEVHLGTTATPPHWDFFPGTSATVTNLSPGAMYYWYVTAWNPAGGSFPSGIWRFTTN